MYEKMMSGEKVDFDSVFDPVKARKSAVISKQRASVGLSSGNSPNEDASVRVGFKTASTEEERQAKPSGNKLREIPGLLKSLKGVVKCPLCHFLQCMTMGLGSRISYP